MFARFFILFLVLPLIACRYPNAFRNAEPKAPHAVLRGEEYPGGDTPFASHINGQPTSFWRFNDVFRIPPGRNSCQVAYSDRQETLAYKTAHFRATAGAQYIISRSREPGFLSPFTATPHPTTTNAWIIHDWRDRAIIQELKSGASMSTVAQAPREDYVFGQSSPDSAIAQYHQRNP